MRKKQLTDKQRAILRYIEQCSRRRGFPPTLREIGAEFAIRSTYGVRYHLDVLEREGYLERDPGTRRGIRLADSARRLSLSAPVLGRVAAGDPLPAVGDGNCEHQVLLDQELFGLDNPDDVFCLRVRGDSMIDAGIHMNDIAVVQRQPTASHGDIVVALLNEEATVKRLQLANGARPQLVPANAGYEPIQVRDTDDFAILGRVVGILRNMNR